MWSSTLPTGTVSDAGRGARTYPERTSPSNSTKQTSPVDIAEQTTPRKTTPSSADNDTRDTRDARQTHETARIEALQNEITRLRDENRRAKTEIERLRSQVKLLRKQLTNHQESRQAIINRYEQLISELERAAASAPTKKSIRKSTRGGSASRKTRGGAANARNEGLAGRVSRWLSE